jgi:hypothetical protein
MGALAPGEASDGRHPMNDWEKQLAGVLRAFEDHSGGFGAHDVFTAVSRIAAPLRDAGALPHEIASELLAFAFNENHSNQYDGWGTYYGPMMSFPVANGARHESPSLSEVTPAVIDYWTRRSREAGHPCLRVRYADLVWDLNSSTRERQ